MYAIVVNEMNIRGGIHKQVLRLCQYLKRNNIKYTFSDMDDICAGFSKIDDERYNFKDKTFEELDEILFGLLTDGIDLESMLEDLRSAVEEEKNK